MRDENKNAQGSVCVGCVCVFVQLLFALIIASALCASAFSRFLFPARVCGKLLKRYAASRLITEVFAENNIAFIQAKLVSARSLFVFVCICLFHCEARREKRQHANKAHHRVQVSVSLFF